MPVIELTFPTPFGPVPVALEVEDTVTPVTDVAAAARTLAEAVLDATEQRLGSVGRKVSCAAGCSMCCHHLVGVSPLEALLLARAVRGLPDDQRARVLARRDAVLEKLDATGLRGRIEANPAGAEGRELVRDYFAARMPCPILEDDRCSVYADRPVPCRQLLVLSDPTHCADPLGGEVEAVPIFLNLQPALEAVSAAVFPDAPRRMQLSVALAWAEENRELETVGARYLALVKGLLQALQAASR
ncbi:MAG: YkgJ family cysteine cluster protein [Alphaproteobacteria bacterium]|nr:YkgJ family cysteine cluster protein [Alphaproteobacteria bacterium]